MSRAFMKGPYPNEDGTVTERQVDVRVSRIYRRMMKLPLIGQRLTNRLERRLWSALYGDLA